jgi:hypothetical protein
MYKGSSTYRWNEVQLVIASQAKKARGFLLKLKRESFLKEMTLVSILYN